MNKILITGATGFVGKNLIPRLYDSHLKTSLVSLLNLDNNNAAAMYNKYAEIINIDLSDKNYKKKIKDFNPDIVLHMASYLTSKDDEESIKKLIDANIEFGTNVLDSLTGTNVRYFINIGTFAEYLYNDGNLTSAYLYAAMKTAFRFIIDYYSRKLGFSFINIIPYTIYGGHDTQKKVIDYIISSLDAKEAVGMSGGEQILDFIHVFDVADFLIELLLNINKIKEHKIEFYVGTGKGTTIRELAEIIEKIFNKTVNIKWGALKYRPMDVMQAIAHTATAKEKLNWKAKISLEEGIQLLKKERYSE